MLTSTQLTVGQVYTRSELRELFQITDATINTGVFRPSDHDSIWLFVTEQKTADRTQYTDRLDGDVLHWEGQMAGYKDRLIIEHANVGLEILLFYRKSKRELQGSGFRYEGRFRYVSHEGAQPTRFILKREIF